MEEKLMEQPQRPESSALHELDLVADLVAEWDVPIPMRDGVVLRADVFRPVGDAPSPVLLSYGGYGKNLPIQVAYPAAWRILLKQRPEVLVGSSGQLMSWELPDPERWIPLGYTLVRVDARGTGRSPGVMDNMSSPEADDIYDAVEWAAAQSWSTGKIGLTGVSYMAIVQWTAASRNPPHLSAICPWEGASDWYRDVSRHGGILSDFASSWYQGQPLKIQHGTGPRGWRNPFTGEPAAGAEELSDEALVRNRQDLSIGMREQEFDGDYYRARSGRFDDIKVPLLSAGNWGGQGMHLRGNVEGFTNAASKHKWLEIHGGNHWTRFYSDEGVELQRRFFDFFLKGEGDWGNEPPVLLQIRHPGEIFVARKEQEWPLARTEWTPFYLNPADSMIGVTLPTADTTATFDALGQGLDLRTKPFRETTEITGPLACHLWVSSSGTDADLFVVVRLFDPDGIEAFFEGSVDTRVPLTQGWLRASHRELDIQLSRPDRPYHSHARALPLTPGEPVELAIEVWPTSIVVPTGYSLGLTVLGRDFDHGRRDAEEGMMAIESTGVGPFTHRDPEDRAAGTLENLRITVHSSAEHPSYLLVPIIPGGEA
ncbi:CocE/NonD family hydrolase [Arthrobacter sp. MI7-26]|nr:CocE/NonD family hydrolase [Arthrobacter sp. MI7-26]